MHSLRARRWRVTLLVALAIGLAVVASRRARAGADAEYRLKAVYLVKFIGYVDWPEDRLPDSGSYLTCVIGESGMVAALKELRGSEKVQRFEVRILDADLPEIAGCHLLFVPEGATDWRDAVRSLPPQARPLLIGESPGFCRAGGMINFFVDDDKVKFEINPDSASAAGLRIQSNLLRLARVVTDAS